MNLTDIRADIIQGIMTHDKSELIAFESADSDNVILVTDADGNRYKLEITKL